MTYFSNLYSLCNPQDVYYSQILCNTQFCDSNSPYYYSAFCQNSTCDSTNQNLYNQTGCFNEANTAIIACNPLSTYVPDICANAACASDPQICDICSYTSSTYNITLCYLYLACSPNSAVPNPAICNTAICNQNSMLYRNDNYCSSICNSSASGSYDSTLCFYGLTNINPCKNNSFISNNNISF